MPKSNQETVILPGQMIGIIGGGQLGRMMAIAARSMGYNIAVLDPTPNCPAAQIADEQIVAPYDDLEAIKKLISISDVITYEFENVDLDAAKQIEASGKLPQGAYALEVTQNRKKEKELLRKMHLPVPTFTIVYNSKETKKALESFPLPAVVKTCRGGYDGKGQIKIESRADFRKACAFVDEHRFCILEQWIPLHKEISIVFSRGKRGDLTVFPLAENVHHNHILAKTIAPAQVSQGIKEKAFEAAKKIAKKLNVVGTFAIELFVQGEKLYINEMAPRPHNSGHYTIEACNVSQFSQHIRAICGLPLMDITLHQPAIMENILGKDLPHVFEEMKTEKHSFIHLYGKKEAKPNRKMGHRTKLVKKKIDRNSF